MINPTDFYDESDYNRAIIGAHLDSLPRSAGLTAYDRYNLDLDDPWQGVEESHDTPLSSSCDFCGGPAILPAEGSVACPDCAAKIAVEGVACIGCDERILPLPAWAVYDDDRRVGWACSYCRDIAADAAELDKLPR